MAAEPAMQASAARRDDRNGFSAWEAPGLPFRGLADRETASPVTPLKLQRAPGGQCQSELPLTQTRYEPRLQQILHEVDRSDDGVRHTRRLQVLLDRGSIEVFGNDGRIALSVGVLSPDADRTVGERYETKRADEEKNPEFAKRRTYLIDPEGMIRKAYRVQDIAGHPAQVLDDLRALMRSSRSWSDD